MQATDDALNSTLMSVNTTATRNVADIENLDTRVSELEQERSDLDMKVSDLEQETIRLDLRLSQLEINGNTQNY